MSPTDETPRDANEEISELIEALNYSSRRLEELTAGEVDAVANSDGRTFLLQHAQDHLRHSEAAKQAAILNALPAHIALLDAQGCIMSVNAAWRRFPGSDAVQRPGYAIGLNYIEICESAQGEGSARAHRIAGGIRAVIANAVKSFSIEYPSQSASQKSWFLVSVTSLADERRNGAVVMHVDVTKQKRHAVERKIMEDALFVERERAEVTLNSIGDAVACTDIAGNVTFLNAVAERMTGWTRQEAAGRPMAKILQILDPTSREALSLSIETGAELGRETRLTSYCILVRRNGSEIAIEDSVAPIHDRDGQVAGAVIVLRDVSASRAMGLQMAHSAQHDFLTGLPNRMLLNDRIGHAIALAARHRKKVAVLFLDLDGFKHINDSLGHLIGDKLLQSVAKRLVDCVRASDTVSRQGGDEFVVLLSEVERSEDGAVSATSMMKRVAEVHAVDQLELHVTASIGVSVYPDDGLDAETLIKNADTAMYQVKENGRQGYRYFKPAMNVRAVERQFIEGSLRRALERQEFVLHYQPKVDLVTGAISGAEALIRWNHPVRGAISPAQFIPVAEDCGLILPIGAWVLREACGHARAWVDAGLPATTMAVNVSAMEFQNERFLTELFSILRSSGLDPTHLELELTESVFMKRAENAASILQILRGNGVRVALDDFGTGYSSLSYLGKFPVDALKIDQSFIRQIGAAGEEAAIVTAVLSMAQSLNLQAVAEGVETPEELAFLRAHRCDQAQGYYLSRPVPPDQFARLLETGIAAAQIPVTSKKRMVGLPTIAPPSRLRSPRFTRQS